MEFCAVVSGLGFLASPVSLSDGTLVAADVENGIQIVVDGVAGSTETSATSKGGQHEAVLGPDVAQYCV